MLTYDAWRAEVYEYLGRQQQHRQVIYFSQARQHKVGQQVNWRQQVQESGDGHQLDPTGYSSVFEQPPRQAGLLQQASEKAC